MTVRAYIYHGQWVGDCTRPGCANAEFLLDGDWTYGTKRPMYVCSYCQQVDLIDWPDPEFMREALAVLMHRPFPHNRNWYPADHPGAVRMGIKEHGQSLDELRQENRAHDVPA
jgi:hypothetical protein